MNIIIEDVDLRDFDAWSGGKDRLDELIELGLVDEVQQFIEDAYPDGCTDTEVNDILWFDEYVQELIESKTKHTFSYEIDIQYTYTEGEEDEDDEGTVEVETTFTDSGDDYDSIEEAVEEIVSQLDYEFNDDALNNLKFTSVTINIVENDSDGDSVESFDFEELVNEGHIDADVLSKYGTVE